MRAVNEKPMRGDFGMRDAKVIMPGSPWKSVLLHRIATSNSGHMPVVGPHEVDSDALGFMAEWILSMAKGAPLEPPDPITSIASPEMALDVLIMRDMLSAQQFEDATMLAVKSTNPHIRGLFEHYLPDNQRIETLGTTASAEKINARKGDAKRGSELFSPIGKAAACLACHFINGSGRDFGPDLSKVGARLTKPQIIESLLTPSKVIAQGFQPVVISMNDGTAQTGFVVKRDDAVVSLKIATGQTLPLKKADIKTEQTLPISLMPEGQLQSLTAQEAADLVEYLAQLK
jgi:putative heme-binding domain-containing protein